MRRSQPRDSAASPVRKKECAGTRTDSTRETDTVTHDNHMIGTSSDTPRTWHSGEQSVTRVLDLRCRSRLSKSCGSCVRISGYFVPRRPRVPPPLYAVTALMSGSSRTLFFSQGVWDFLEELHDSSFATQPDLEELHQRFYFTQVAWGHWTESQLRECLLRHGARVRVRAHFLWVTFPRCLFPYVPCDPGRFSCGVIFSSHFSQSSPTWCIFSCGHLCSSARFLFRFPPKTLAPQLGERRWRKTHVRRCTG